MKTLYLLRHAHSAPNTPPMSDFERVLTPQGIQEARAVGQFMRMQEMFPEFVLSSSSVRTTQTAQLTFGELFDKSDIEVAGHFDPKFYHASATEMLSEIQSVDSSINSLIMVGHNPGIANLAFTFGKMVEYKPATLSVFSADCKSWHDFLPEKVKLEKVFCPGD